MPDPKLYAGREQTYVKHLVLENYLERVAYNIFSFNNEFVYIDGFSGPWQAQGGSYEDTSFHIAMTRLTKICEGLREGGKDKNFRCLFIEKNPKAFAELKEAVKQYDNVEIINGPFADNIDGICKFAKSSFAFIFIDPTTWTGYPLDRIKPLLHLRGEVLINFMSDYINRFIEHPKPKVAATFDELFGSAWFDDWATLHEQGLSREAAAIEVYRRRLKQNSNFQFVTSTRILKPLADRSYFHLIYGTENWKGIHEFRAVEKKVVAEQEQVRGAAKYKKQVATTGQTDIFREANMDVSIATYQSERETQLERGHAVLLQQLQAYGTVKYEDLIGPVQENPLVWESDLKGWIKHLRDIGQIQSPNWGERQRVPKRGTRIQWNAK